MEFRFVKFVPKMWTLQPFQSSNYLFYTVTWSCYNVLEAEECLQGQWVLHLQQ